MFRKIIKQPVTIKKLRTKPYTPPVAAIDSVLDDVAGLLDLNKKLPVIQNEIKRYLKNSPDIAEILIAFVENYKANNFTRRQLLNPMGRRLVLELIRNIKIETNYQTVRRAENKRIKNGNYLLFLDREDELNFISHKGKNSVSKLDHYIKVREKHYPELKIKANPTGRPFTKKQRGTIDSVRREFVTLRASIQNNILQLIEYTKSLYPNVVIYDEYSGAADIKSVESIRMKMQNNLKRFGEMTDILRGAIVVEGYYEIALLMSIIEEAIGNDNILEFTNKFVSPRKRSPYRAIHYIIKIDDRHCFELQIKTLGESIMGDIDHDVIHKDIYHFNKSYKESLTSLYWGMHITDSEKYFTKQNRRDGYNAKK